MLFANSYHFMVMYLYELDESAVIFLSFYPIVQSLLAFLLPYVTNVFFCSLSVQGTIFLSVFAPQSGVNLSGHVLKVKKFCCHKLPFTNVALRTDS